MISVLGGILLVGGLYFVQWGKIKEAKEEKQNCGLANTEKQSIQTNKDGIINGSNPQQFLVHNSSSWV